MPDTRVFLVCSSDSSAAPMVGAWNARRRADCLRAAGHRDVRLINAVGQVFTWWPPTPRAEA